MPTKVKSLIAGHDSAKARKWVPVLTSWIASTPTSSTRTCHQKWLRRVKIFDSSDQPAHQASPALSIDTSTLPSARVSSSGSVSSQLVNSRTASTAAPAVSGGQTLCHKVRGVRIGFSGSSAWPARRRHRCESPTSSRIARSPTALRWPRSSRLPSARRPLMVSPTCTNTPLSSLVRSKWCAAMCTSSSTRSLSSARPTRSGHPVIGT